MSVGALLTSIATNSAVLTVLMSAAATSEAQLCQLQTKRNSLKEANIQAERAASIAYSEWIKLKQHSEEVACEFGQLDRVCQVALQLLLSKQDVIQSLERETSRMKDRMFAETGFQIVSLPNPTSSAARSPAQARQALSSTNIVSTEPQKRERSPSAECETRSLNTCPTKRRVALPSQESLFVSSFPGILCRGPEIDRKSKALCPITRRTSMGNNSSINTSHKSRSSSTISSIPSKSLVAFSSDIDDFSYPVDKKCGYRSGRKEVDAVIWIKKELDAKEASLQKAV
ncbi:UNVERIFIED_CONTAM: hypothetical protein HDU68_006254 [Siphonaria sp. JEL0065]|nr:hypothetical protein HDU68_006254 [Siphonaria sp. JEL0065]